MIELKHDQLCFSFPAIESELHRLADQFIHDSLPGLLSEDRAVALEGFLISNYNYRGAPDDYRQNALRTVKGLSQHAIVEAFTEVVRERINSNCQNAGRMYVEFQRTMRIPDDESDYDLPPGLGNFPLRHVDDFEDKVPAHWLDRGGVMMPMYQSEALWLNFNSSYPFALRVATGKINAVTGDSWREGLNRNPQDYLVLPEQPWLDGFAVEKGVIRQFVAMPLGAGYSVEEQLSGKAEFGGLQLEARPMKASVYFREELRPNLPQRLADILHKLLPPPLRSSSLFSEDSLFLDQEDDSCDSVAEHCACSMGVAVGGRMKQEIYEDEHALEDWDLEESSRCFVHLCDALLWREITGANPPHPPATAREYERAGLPWFDFYRDDVAVLEGSKTLAGVKSVVQISKEKGDKAVTGNDSVKSKKMVHCGPKKRPGQVREWVGP